MLHVTYLCRSCSSSCSQRVISSHVTCDVIGSRPTATSRRDVSSINRNTFTHALTYSLCDDSDVTNDNMTWLNVSAVSQGPPQPSLSDGVNCSFLLAREGKQFPLRTKKMFLSPRTCGAAKISLPPLPRIVIASQVGCRLAVDQLLHVHMVRLGPIVRENVWSKAKKRKKSPFLDFQKKR